MSDPHDEPGDDSADDSTADSTGVEPWELRPARDVDLPLGERMRGLSRERGLIDTGMGFVWWTAMKLFVRTYHRLRIHGREHLPTAAPFVLVANHSSHLDAMVLGAALCPRLRHCVYPVAAGDHFFASPFTSAFAAFVLNALPMWRRSAGRYALEQLRERLLDEPCGFILFPEGTRSRTGELAPFKPGLGMIVAGTAIPVIPCLLEGTHDAHPANRRLPRPRRITLRVGPALTFADAPSKRDGWNRVAQEAEAAVRALAARAS